MFKSSKDEKTLVLNKEAKQTRNIILNQRSKESQKLKMNDSKERDRECFDVNVLLLGRDYKTV